MSTMSKVVETKPAPHAQAQSGVGPTEIPCPGLAFGKVSNVNKT